MERTEEIKKRIYEIIEASHGKDVASIMYDLMIMVTVFSSLTPLMRKTTNLYTTIMEIVTILVFVMDYVLRIYTSDYKMGVKSYKAYLYYAFTPMAIIDLLSILPVVALFLPGNRMLELFRVVRVLRVLKVIRYSHTMMTIANVVRRVKRELGAVLIFTILYIYAAALILFQIEPELFENFFEALYWATISITTIGYGDYFPVTPEGKVVTMLSSLVGMAVIALPTGIITAAYMDEIRRSKTKGKLVL
jgi:voltage-gated potassium channel